MIRRAKDFDAFENKAKHGDYVSWSGCTGRIQTHKDDIYVLQDERDGSKVPGGHSFDGYKFSWIVKADCDYDDLFGETEVVLSDEPLEKHSSLYKKFLSEKKDGRKFIYKSVEHYCKGFSIYFNKKLQYGWPGTGNDYKYGWSIQDEGDYNMYFGIDGYPEWIDDDDSQYIGKHYKYGSQRGICIGINHKYNSLILELEEGIGHDCQGEVPKDYKPVYTGKYFFVSKSSEEYIPSKPSQYIGKIYDYNGYLSRYIGECIGDKTGYGKDCLIIECLKTSPSLGHKGNGFVPEGYTPKHTGTYYIIPTTAQEYVPSSACTKTEAVNPIIKKTMNLSSTIAASIVKDYLDENNNEVSIKDSIKYLLALKDNAQDTIAKLEKQIKTAEQIISTFSYGYDGGNIKEMEQGKDLFAKFKAELES